MSVATVWIVFKIPTESELRIRLSTSFNEGNLLKTSSRSTKLPKVFNLALLMTPPATAFELAFLLPPWITLTSALGKFPVVMTFPETMFEAPLLAEVISTLFVPTFEVALPDPTPDPPPTEVTTKSETPVSLPCPPPTKLTGRKVYNPDAPVALEVALYVVDRTEEDASLFSKQSSTQSLAAVLREV